MFEIGDYVVFGTDGVCVVEAIGSIDIEGVSREKLYYTLSPVGKVGNNRIFAPIDSKRVVMRKIMSSDEADKLIRSIGELEPLVIPDERRREDTYKAVLQSCDCVQLVRLIKVINERKLSRSAAGKKLPVVDERYFSMAENSLYSELCFPLKLDKSDVRRYILENVAEGGYVEIE